MSAETLLSRLDKVRKMGPDRSYRPLPSVNYLCECFDMTPHGELFWKVRPESHFKTHHEFKRWNTRYSGKSACVDGGGFGYFLVCIDSVRFKAHRVVYAIATGIDPLEKMIDHADGNTKNNNPSNLRLATPSENAINFSGARKDNSHGTRGVTWNAANRKWEVNIHKNGKRTFIGLYAKKEDAKKASYASRSYAFGEFFRSQNDC